MVISPVSGRSTPIRILTRVDLPAPFSPTRPWISPDRNRRSTESSARTPGNRLVIWRASNNSLAAFEHRREHGLGQGIGEPDVVGKIGPQVAIQLIPLEGDGGKDDSML